MKRMKRFLSSALIFSLVLSLSGGMTFAASDQAEMIFFNGKIVSMDEKKATYQAVAIKGERILAVGTDDQIKKLAGTKTVMNDLRGKTVVPGMMDTHLHFLRYGLTFLQIKAVDKSKEWILEQVKEKTAASDGKVWIRGSGWNQMSWTKPMFPNAVELDAVSGSNPVVLTRSDNHTMWVNSKALQLAGITKDTPDPQGGKIERDAAGNPTGILVDTAMDLVKKVLPQWSKEEIANAYIQADKMYSKIGLTTVHDAGDTVDLEVLKRLISEGKVNTRVYEVLDKTTATDFLAKGIKPETGLYNNHLTIKGIKLKTDGALGSRGASMLSEYSDAPGTTGNVLIKKEEVKDYARKALDLGYQLSVHAIGDKANKEALNAFEEVFKEKSIIGNPNRFNIVHAQVVEMSDFARFGKLQIPALVQPVHATGDMNMAETRIGSKRILGAYAWRTLKDQGVVLTGGSDSPNDYVEPIFGIHAAVTRMDKNNLPAGGWYSEQCLNRQEALELYTTNAAWLGFEEKIKGSLEVGKLADMVVLSEDIMTMPAQDIHKAVPVKTIIGGKIVYSGPEVAVTEKPEAKTVPASGDTASLAKGTPASAASEATRVATDPTSYTVKVNDKLWKIAARFSADWKAIANLNHLENPSLIYPGQVLLMP